jgi:DNA-binding transcriptional ArsR family regulator
MRVDSKGVNKRIATASDWSFMERVADRKGQGYGRTDVFIKELVVGGLWRLGAERGAEYRGRRIPPHTHIRPQQALTQHHRTLYSSMVNEETMQGTLKPTLWRTCRVLANRTRLRLLAIVIQNPGSPVSALAEAAGIHTTLGSRYLRALNARGMIRAHRCGAWVFYSAASDRSLPASGVLLAVFKRTLTPEPEAVDRAFRLLTAFTHPRRVAIVREVRNDSLRPCELRRRLRMSQPAVERHLKKLRDRGFLASGRHGYRLRRPADPLGRALLKLASE